MRRCKGFTRPTTTVKRLAAGIHPTGDTNLATAPRLLTRRDVGNDAWIGVASPELSLLDYRESADASLAAMLALHVQQMLTMIRMVLGQTLIIRLDCGINL